MNNNNTNITTAINNNKELQQQQQQQQQQCNHKTDTTSKPTSLKLIHLPLKPRTLSKLLSNGYQTTTEVLLQQQLSKSNNANTDEINKNNEEDKNVMITKKISLECNCSYKEAYDILHEVYNCQEYFLKASLSSTVSAASILSQTNNSTNNSNNQLLQRPIVSFCRSIDELLGGGISTCEVTELVGEPGIGKTQLAMQLCINTKIPYTFGGISSESIYIDTEGSFTPERCYTMSQALVNHVHKSAIKRNASGKVTDVPEWFTVDNVLQSINVFRVHDDACLVSTIYSLKEFLIKRKQNENAVPIKLIVVDSIAFHFRYSTTQSSSDYKKRTRILLELSSFLSELATTFQLAVIVINQMTTTKKRQTKDSTTTTNNTDYNTTINTNTTRILPALGESWAHATTTKLVLEYDDNANNNNNRRVCTLVKSPCKPYGKALFSIFEIGIRDVQPSSS